MSEKATSLNSEAIKNLLPANGAQAKVKVFNTIGSTNTEAKRLLSDCGKEVLIICAEGQTAGRGRNGKSFFSPEKTGLYMSVAVRPEISLPLASRATTAAAVAVCETIEALTDKKPEIKWVNDIFLDGKKICGILTEAVSDYKAQQIIGLVIGVGINISTTDFPDELTGVAGSLDESVLDRNVLAAGIAERIIGYAKDLENTDYIQKYKDRCFVLGRKISFISDGVGHTAEAVDLDENAGLVVRTDDGETLTLRSGEISIKI